MITIASNIEILTVSNIPEIIAAACKYATEIELDNAERSTTYKFSDGSLIEHCMGKITVCNDGFENPNTTEKCLANDVLNSSKNLNYLLNNCDLEPGVHKSWDVKTLTHTFSFQDGSAIHISGPIVGVEPPVSNDHYLDASDYD